METRVRNEQNDIAESPLAEHSAKAPFSAASVARRWPHESRESAASPPVKDAAKKRQKNFTVEGEHGRQRLDRAEPRQRRRHRADGGDVPVDRQLSDAPSPIECRPVIRKSDGPLSWAYHFGDVPENLDIPRQREIDAIGNGLMRAKLEPPQMYRGLQRGGRARPKLG